MNIIIGNTIAFVAAILMVYTGLVLRKNKILILQIIQMFLLMISNLILGGITGAISNVIGCIRNYLCYKDKMNTITKMLIIIITTAISLYFNNLGIIGLLPIMSTILYTWLIDSKNIIYFKLSIVITMIMWCIYDFNIKSYIMMVIDFLTVITTSISIYKLRKKK